MQASKIEFNMPDYIKEYKDKYKVLVSDKGLNLNNFEDWKHNKLNFIKKINLLLSILKV